MGKLKLLRTGAAGLATTALLAVMVPATYAGTNSDTAGTTATTATDWTVNAGVMSQSGIMAMSFFPNVMTIDVGDTITFKGMAHTVTFPGPDGKLPPTTSPKAQVPAGTNTFDGSAFTSSGMLTGKPYSLTFTKAGVYPYYCLLHPGMMGVVIVNPAGTAYPMTQSQYDVQAQQEEQADYTAGEQLVNSFQVKTESNTNGTKTYYAQTDVPESQTYSFNLTSENGSNATGSALVAFSQPPSQTDPNITYSVDVKLSGLTPGQTYTAVLSEGKSDSGVPVPNSQFANVIVNSDGTGTVTGAVKAVGLPQGIWYLDVYGENHDVVASGLINHPSFADERFLPNDLKIHVGDTLVWTQTGPNEVHTVTFLPSGWSDIPNESLMPVPYGGHIYAGTGFFNSGFMIPGATYKITFIKAGDYQYRCLLHDVMGMISNVDVAPRAGVSTFALNGSVMNVPSKVVGGITYVPIWYVQQLLQKSGITSTWDGRNWKMTTTIKVKSSGIDAAKGPDHLYLNGQRIQNATGKVFVDPNSGHNTTYLPLHDVQQALKVVGLNGTWDGSTWDLTPSAHAGSVPAGSNSTGS